MSYPLKLASLRAMDIYTGTYLDEYYDEYAAYEDTSRLVIVPSKLGTAFPLVPEGWEGVSSIFIYSGELEEFPDIWAAITAVWSNRLTYLTIALLKDDMDAALLAAGYSFPA